VAATIRGDGPSPIVNISLSISLTTLMAYASLITQRLPTEAGQLISLRVVRNGAAVQDVVDAQRDEQVAAGRRCVSIIYT
jgi:hypothetical protein